LLPELDDLTGGVPDAASDTAPPIPTDAAVDAKASPYRAAVLQDKPVAYLRLGEKGTPSVATDEVGAFAGSYSASVELGVPGAIANDDDTAARFGNGTTPTYVSLGDVLRFSGNAAYSFELWVKPAAPRNYALFIVARASPDNTVGHFVFTLANTLEFERRANASSADGLYPGVVLSTTQFSHVVVTYDGLKLSLFVNGSLLAATNASNPVTSAVGGLTLGATSPSDATNGFVGVLDEFAVYDRALDPSRVAAHYALGKP
jgi:hypothetical protein